MTTVTTFGAASTAFLAFRKNRKADRTASKHEWLHRKLRALHDQPLAALRAPTVMTVLRKIESKGNHETARRCGQYIAAVFRHAVREGWCEINPATDLRGGLEGAKAESHPGITDPEKFGRLMLLIDMPGYSHPTIYNALRLIARTALRPGELRNLRWEDVDLQKAEIRIPGERMKMRKPFLSVLSTQAIEILEAQQAVTMADDLTQPRYVFPGPRSGRPISDATMGMALRSMFISPAEHVPHGFRVSFSSLMHEAGQDPAVIELCLAHVKGGVAGIYDRSQRVPDRRKLMQDWGNAIEAMKRAAL